jgi:hypothetical protein
MGLMINYNYDHRCQRSQRKTDTPNKEESIEYFFKTSHELEPHKIPQ